HITYAIQPQVNLTVVYGFQVSEPLVQGGTIVRTGHDQRFLTGGKSVRVPSAACAAMPMLSPSVGCGWIVRAKSTLSAPISMARAISPIMSPALVPTMA